jgi:hypothetical protein
MVLEEAWLYNTKASSLADRYRDKVFVINWLIRHNHYRSYLEIGTRWNECLARIEAPQRTGVDPVSGGTHRMTSDEYFATHHETFDLIFIDGLHESQQVQRDLDHALAVLNKGGLVVLHDCNPLCLEDGLPKGKNGDGYKVIWRALTRPDLDIRVLNVDWGLGLVQKRASTVQLTVDYPTQVEDDAVLYKTYKQCITADGILVSWDVAEKWLPNNYPNEIDPPLNDTVISYSWSVLPLSSST